MNKALLPSKAARTRQHIVETAAPIFNRKGYAATSLSDLLAPLRLTKGALYGNFKDKDEIALAAFSYSFSQLKNGYVQALQDAGPQDRVAQLKALVDFPLQKFEWLSQTGGCPLLNTAVEADDGDTLLLAAVQGAFRQWKVLITNIIRQGMAEQQIKADTQAENLATLLVALLEGGILLAKVNNTTADLLIAVRHAQQMLEDLRT
jgi:AcrR family transcriptional regulator